MTKYRCPCCTKPRFVLSAFVFLAWFFGTSDLRIQWWMWEMTPIPMGFPSWRQYLDGVVLFASGRVRRTQE